MITAELFLARSLCRLTNTVWRIRIQLFYPRMTPNEVFTTNSYFCQRLRSEFRAFRPSQNTRAMDAIEQALLNEPYNPVYNFWKAKPVFVKQ